MNGEAHIELSTAKIKYNLKFDRNISLIRGHSGTGKSYLCSLLAQALSGDETVALNSHGIQCIVMPAVTINSPTTLPWDEIIAQASNTIFFIDEMCDCLHSGSFSKVIKNTSNYYVIISRKDYSDLTYSVKAIYEFKEDIVNLIPVITNQQLYPSSSQTIAPCKLITEDEGAGYFFYQHLYSIPVIPARSKTRIAKCLKTELNKHTKGVVVIVDGAAFGSELDKCMQLISCDTSYHIYFPESFEWILLHSLVFQDNPEIQHILIDYLKTIDWTKFISVERYMTHVIETETEKLGILEYNKSANSLDPCFINSENLEHIRTLIPFNWEESYTSVFGE